MATKEVVQRGGSTQLMEYKVNQILKYFNIPFISFPEVGLFIFLLYDLMIVLILPYSLHKMYDVQMNIMYFVFIWNQNYLTIL